MKTWGTKKSVFAASLSYVLFLVALYILSLLHLSRVDCYAHSWCRDYVGNLLSLAVFGFFPLFPTLLLSLLTYRMHDEVFRAWWNFARFMVPIIVLATLLVNMMPSNGGFFNMDGLIYLFVVAPLYAILILVSLWKVFRKYRELKKG
jgi:hypothetical protein